MEDVDLMNKRFRCNLGLTMVGMISLLFVVLQGQTPAPAQIQPQAGPAANGPRVAKNVIVMISDGCGFNQVEAATIYRFGKPEGWCYQQFPVKLAICTFPDGSGYDPALVWGDFLCVKKNVTDSAAAATALATGVKTYNGAIGVGPDKQPVENILERAEKRGMATGVVTSVPFSHATPAGFLAHNEGRGNYCDIALNMASSAAEVVMGAGHPEYGNSGATRGTPKYEYLSQDLWDKLKSGQACSDANGDGQPEAWKLVQTKEEFQALANGNAPDRVFGIAEAASTLQEGRGGDAKADAFTVPFNTNVPSLSEMTLGAISVLHKDPDGFCMMVEGGAVDWAGHSNLSGRVIEEEVDFSEAVEAVVKWVEKNSNWNETLLIVTGDHETGYLTGPGSDPKWQPLVNNGAGKMPGMEWHYASHTNNLLPLFAKGAGSSYFTSCMLKQDPVRGTYCDNTVVAKAVFAALGK
jgi:alkaline phosphatase